MQLGRVFRRMMARPAMLLALAAFAPLVVYAAVNGYIALDRRQAILAAESTDDARALVDNVDRQLASALQDAEALAELPALDQVNGRAVNLPVFSEVARRTRSRHPDWMAVLLMAPDGRWLLDTRPTDDLTKGRITDWASFEKAVRTRAPVIGDVVLGPNGRWGIPLRAPVVRGGKVVYVVTVVLSPQAIHQTLVSLRLAGPWVTLIVNAQGHIVARLPRDDTAIGAAVTPEAMEARARGGGGSYVGRSLSGEQVQSFYWVSPTTHWSAHAAMSRALYQAPLRNMLATMLTGFVVCLVLAGTLVVLWVRDFETRRKRGAAVEQATRIEALGRLTGGVAHDFNNLLTVIQGNTEILDRRLKGQGPAERPLAAIRAATDRAAKLTRQLLVFARGGPAEAALVDLSRKVTELLGPISQLTGTGVIVDTELEPGLPPVRVDPLQLEAALLNLAANARDAMKGSGVMLIGLRRLGSWIALSVKDNGPGFDPAVLARVFDPFFTTKPVGQGTGLGLSQVYGLVRGAGGRVDAANAPGGGAVVTLCFPPAVGEAPAEEPLLQPAPSAAAGLASVLLVDDNEAVRGATAAFLRECGLSVVEASDAAAALRTLESVQVEAVVTDIIMPGEMDGIGLAEIIRSRMPRLPVLLVSGFSERVAEAQARGFSVVGKPYSLPDLERRLRGMVEPSAA